MNKSELKLIVKILKKLWYELTEWVKENKKICIITGIAIGSCLLLGLMTLFAGAVESTSEEAPKQKQETSEDTRTLDNYDTIQAEFTQAVSVNGYIITLGKSNLKEVKEALGLQDNLEAGEWQTETTKYKASEEDNTVDVITSGSCWISGGANNEIAFYVKAFGGTMPEDTEKLIVWGISVHPGGMFDLKTELLSSDALDYQTLVDSLGEPTKTNVSTGTQIDEDVHSLEEAVAEETETENTQVVAGGETAPTEPTTEQAPSTQQSEEGFTAEWETENTRYLVVNNQKTANSTQRETYVEIEVMDDYE